MKLNVKKLQEQMSKKLLEGSELKARQDKINEFYTKADELYNTDTANNGQEFIPTDVLSSNLIDLSPEVNNFLALFTQGFQGNDLNNPTTFPLIGEAGVMLPRSQNKDASAFTANNITEGPNSDKLIVNQGFFKKEIGVTEIEATFSVIRLDALIRRKLDMYFSNTVMSYILNADSDTTTANINDKGITVAASTNDVTKMAAEGWNDGIRKTGIANTVEALGTLVLGSWTTLLKLLPEYSGERTKLKIFLDQVSALEVEDVLVEQLKFVDRNAIVEGYIGNYKGISHISTKHLVKVGTDGKVDLTTPANNTKGQMILVYIPAVVHGFGKRVRNIGTEFNIDDDFSISLTTNFGCAIANKKAGLGKTIATGLIDL